MTKQEIEDSRLERDLRVAKVVQLMQDVPPETLSFSMRETLRNVDIVYDQSTASLHLSTKCGSVGCIAGFTILALQEKLNNIQIERVMTYYLIMESAGELLFLDNCLYDPFFSPVDWDDSKTKLLGHSMQSDREDSIKALLWAAKRQVELGTERGVKYDS